MGKGLSYWKKWGVVVNYCWNYGLSKLLLHFIEYRLDQLNIKYTKTVVNSTIQYFEGCSRKKCLSTKCLMFFGPPTTKWRPCKFFAKLNRNYLLMANIFKVHEYETFGLMKMHNKWKIWFANTIFSLWKAWFTINGPPKMLFFNFCLFSFSKFQIIIVKNLIMHFYSITNIFDLHIFENETVTLLIFKKISTDMHFVSLFFLNERKIATSLLMIHLKCTVVHYTNLDWSSKNKPFLNCGSLNMLFRFFRFLIYVYFNETFVKKLMK